MNDSGIRRRLNATATAFLRDHSTGVPSVDKHRLQEHLEKEHPELSSAAISAWMEQGGTEAERAGTIAERKRYLDIMALHGPKELRWQCYEDGLSVQEAAVRINAARPRG